MLPERTDNDVAADATAEVDAASPKPAEAGPETTETKATAEAASAAVDAAAPEVSETKEEQAVPAESEHSVQPAAASASANDPHAYDGPSIPFVPHHALTEGMMALAFLTFGFIFIALVPVPLDARANPFLSPEGVLPEWYLLAPFELMHLVPAVTGFAIMTLALGGLMAWPFIDRRPRRMSRRPFILAVSFLAIGAIIGLSILALMHVEHL
jgi:quinol-cytochrome oxidoreductase complex cytochrome b subunit